MDKKLPNPALSLKDLCKAGKMAEEIRIEMDLGIEEFCKKLGTSTSSYYAKRKGDTNFTKEEKKKLKKMGKIGYEEFYKVFFE